jgi:hypothetical protein
MSKIRAETGHDTAENYRQHAKEAEQQAAKASDPMTKQGSWTLPAGGGKWLSKQNGTAGSGALWLPTFS